LILSRVLADQRRTDCIFYSECLDRAARVDGGLSCGKCPGYEIESDIPLHDVIGLLALCRVIAVEATYDHQRPQSLVQEIRQAMTGGRPSIDPALIA
jgi:hypothetical protein